MYLMNSTKLLGFIFFFLFFEARGQQFFAKKYDVGVNMTNLISKVISIADDKDDKGNGILFRVKNDKKGLVGGLNVLLDEDNFFSTSGNSINTQTQLLGGRLGFEWYKLITSKLIFGYGLSSIVSSEIIKTREITSNVNSFLETNTTQNNFGIGCGPILRFEFVIVNGFSISTESSLIGLFENRKSTVETSLKTNSFSFKKFQLSTTVPSVLYLNIHF
jgi:hypothetical protein